MNVTSLDNVKTKEFPTLDSGDVGVNIPEADQSKKCDSVPKLSTVIALY